MTVFALVVLLAIDFPAVFLYTKAKTAWASDCNLCLHNLKLSSFSQAVFFISPQHTFQTTTNFLMMTALKAKLIQVSLAFLLVINLPIMI